jgi:uncharacterized protein YecE (DUF72 family)
LPRSALQAVSLPALTHPSNLFVGTSGWAYPTWKPGFYPEKLSSRNFLGYYSSQLGSVEVNYTFRTLPTTTQLQGWLDATPASFRFAFKAPQSITHFQRLVNSNDTVAEFLSSIALARKANKLGPLLFQLPPNFAADKNDNQLRLEAFLKLPAFKRKALQIAFEFRHASWFTETTYATLRRYNAALCIAESNDLATPDVATADFRCYRLRRDGGYSLLELEVFARRFCTLAETSEIYAYFKHVDEPTGALNASALLHFAGSR